MTLTKTTKRTATARTSGAHRTRTTRRSVHRRQEPRRRERAAAAQNGASARPAMITVDGELLTEARDWAVLAGVSLAGWLAAAIAFGVV
jgi:hypothetical protein